MLTDIYLESSSHISVPLSDSDTELTLKLKRLMPNTPRRINRCIRVSLLGAFNCIKDHAGKAVDVFLCSSSIGVSVMNDLLESVIIKKEQPKPISFIHSIGNSATFYVSQQLALSGESLFLSETSDCLAHMLLLSAVKMKSGSESVMLGRIHTDNEFTECSWLLLRKAPAGNSLIKLSFESMDTVGGGESILMPGSIHQIADFKQLAETPAITGYVGSAKFQRQSGIVIRVSSKKD